MSTATTMNFKQLDIEELDFEQMTFEQRKLKKSLHVRSALRKLAVWLGSHLTTLSKPAQTTPNCAK
jgi:hypothetical protein